jgi:hypothetical protein
MLYIYQKFHSVVCAVHVYQFIVYKLDQPHAHTCTVSPHSDMFRWPATTIIRENNSTEQSAAVSSSLSCQAHIAIFRAPFRPTDYVNKKQNVTNVRIVNLSNF